MSETKFTPLPWKLGAPDSAVVIGADGKEVAYTFTPRDCEEQDANAEYIVRACNSHNELYIALKIAHKLLTKFASAVGGNDHLQGCEEFYRGFNAVTYRVAAESSIVLTPISAALEKAVPHD